MRIILAALFLLFMDTALAQGLWNREAVVCHTERQALETIALNKGRLELSYDSMRYAKGCKFELAFYIRLLAMPSEPIWNGVQFKIYWVALYGLVTSDGRLDDQPFVGVFIIVWEYPGT